MTTTAPKIIPDLPPAAPEELGRDMLVSALEYLVELSRRQTQPPEALAGLGELRRRFAGVGIELVWETQAYDDCVHYDLLLTGVGASGTASLGFAPARAIPWPLRGAQRSDEAFLVHVNGRALKVADAISALETLWHDDRAVRQIVDTALISQALKADPPSVQDADLQSALEDFRRALGLHTGEATWAWMRARGLTHELLERRLEGAAQMRALRRRVTESALDSELTTRLADYDVVRLGRLTLETPEAASALAGAIARRETDFLTAAHARLMHQRPDAGAPILRCQRRHTLDPRLRELLGESAAPVLLGPLDQPGGYELVMVFAITPAQPDDSTRAEVRRVLFDRWLHGERESATVRWNWGDSVTLRNQP